MLTDDPADAADLQLSDAVRVNRLARQVAGLQRQIEIRASENERLQVLLSDCEGARVQSAEQLNALLNTRTMRVLRRPRALYSGLRNLSRSWFSKESRPRG